MLAKKEFYPSIEELSKAVKKLSLNMDFVAKAKIVQVAYLFTSEVCDIQFDDRLRINLIANALNISLESVNELIEDLEPQDN